MGYRWRRPANSPAAHQLVDDALGMMMASVLEVAPQSYSCDSGNWRCAQRRDMLRKSAQQIKTARGHSRTANRIAGFESWPLGAHQAGIAAVRRAARFGDARGRRQHRMQRPRRDDLALHRSAAATISPFFISCFVEHSEGTFCHDLFIMLQPYARVAASRRCAVRASRSKHLA